MSQATEILTALANERLLREVRCVSDQPLSCRSGLAEVFRDAGYHSDCALAARAYLVQLGYRPWNEHAQLSPKPPRRTGRTTRALLGAIAQCAGSRLPLAVTAGLPDSAAEYCCVGFARDLVARLKLAIDVQPECRAMRRWNSADYVLYIDHVTGESRTGS